MIDNIAAIGSERLPVRFWQKVNPDETGCWLWLAGRGRGGYGRFMTTPRVTRAAHRVAYELLVGPIPDGLQLDHLCRVRHCVNPDHLEPVTQTENLHRGETITASCAAKTHCPQGHPYSGSNLYVDPSGARRCRSCVRQSNANRRASNPDRHRRQTREANQRYRAKQRADRP